jgi:carbamoyl-phosphate synthase large subunit
VNVLLSCVGRRGYLVRYFQEALAGTGKVVATNSSADTAGMAAADEAIVMPPVADPSYPMLYATLCQKQQIGLACSLFDLELPVLAPLRDRLAECGTRLAVSSPSVIDLCFDKWRTHQFALELGICQPRSYLTLAGALAAVSGGDTGFPLVVKPRWGTGSIGVEVAHDADGLVATWQHVKRALSHTYLDSMHGRDRDDGLLVQEMISGTEYGVDVVNDLEGGYTACFVKQKLAMRSGETDAAVTEKNPRIEAIMRQVAQRLGHVGVLDVDVMRRGEELHLLEMNPRFGGGYPFSHLAGANIPAALVAWAKGEDPDPAWLALTPGVEGYKETIPTLSRRTEL